MYIYNLQQYYQPIQTLQQQIQVSGIVSPGVQPGCYVLNADNGIVYDLKGFVLTNIGPTTYNMRVNVVGIIRTDIVSICQQGTPLEVISISRQQTPAPAPYPYPYPVPIPTPTPSPIPTRYTCINGRCIPTPFGEFGSEFECRRSCGLIPPSPTPTRYTCVRGRCIQTPFGEFDNEFECRRSCGLIPPLPLPQPFPGSPPTTMPITNSITTIPTGVF